MRILILVSLLLLFCSGVGALRKRQLQSTHAGYCPFYPVHCAIYCPPSTIDMILSTTSNGCRKDVECADDEKCCPPACGCTNKCVKAVQNPGWPTKFQQ